MSVDHTDSQRPEEWQAARDEEEDEAVLYGDEDDDSDWEQEEDMDEAEEDWVVEEGALTSHLHRMSDPSRTLSGFPLLADVPITPVEHEIAGVLARDTAADNPRCAMQPADKRPRVYPTLSLLQARETNTAGHGGRLSVSQKRHVASNHFLPTQPAGLVDRLDSRAYVGQFSQDGSLYVAAFQSARRIRAYAVHGGWRRVKDVHARNLRWTVTDIALSPDQRRLLYATINHRVNMVDLQCSEGVHSVANVTDIHEELNFSSGAAAREVDDGWGGRDYFGIWSIQWSADGREVIAGTNSNSIMVHNIERGLTTVRLEGHCDDVNAVRFLAPGDDALMVSGGDEGSCKLWDRRDLRGNRPALVLVGHTEGVTHIDCKGDGRYLISNAKDQTIKLWDIRSGVSSQSYDRHDRGQRIAPFNWDYRWMEYPGSRYCITHPRDCSVATYRGHEVLQTLVRAYWSPMASTGQKFIYTGSSNGQIHIYDVVTRKPAAKLSYHHQCVRDCHWHPHLPLLVSTSFDGSVVRWDPLGSEEGAALPRSRGDAYGDY